MLSGIKNFISGSNNWFEYYGKHPLQIFNHSIFRPLTIVIWYKNVYPGIKGFVRRLWEAPPANLQIVNIQATGDL